MRVRPEPADQCQAHEVHLDQPQHLTAQHPGKAHPAQQADHQNDVADTGPQERHCGECHHEIGQGQKHIGEAHQNTVDPATEDATDQGDQGADCGGQEDG